MLLKNIKYRNKIQQKMEIYDKIKEFIAYNFQVYLI